MTPTPARVLAERAEYLGKTSNNVAEYSGLIAGLRWPWRLDPGATVEVRMDSKLVVEQMSGRWKIKHEDMRRLALEARDLSRISDAGGSVDFEWIPREKNKAADALSNHAMDGKSVHRVLTDEERRRPGLGGSSRIRLSQQPIRGCHRHEASVRPAAAAPRAGSARQPRHATLVAAVRRLVDSGPSSAPMTPRPPGSRRTSPSPWTRTSRRPRAGPARHRARGPT